MTTLLPKLKDELATHIELVRAVSTKPGFYTQGWEDFGTRSPSETGLEASPSEAGSFGKFNGPFTNGDQKENENNSNLVKSGDYIRIIHKKTAHTISTTPKNIEATISTRNIFINNEIEDSHGPQRIWVPTKFIDKKLPSSGVMLSQHKKYGVSDLWEVQKRNGSYGAEGTFRFKSICNNLYLCQDPISERLKLTSDGNREECYFYLYPKDKYNQNGEGIEYRNLLRIQSSNGSYIQQPRDASDLEDLCGPKQTEASKLLFYIERVSREYADTALKLYVFGTQLTSFYQFLQSWGVSSLSGLLTKEDMSVYDYGKALESDRDLFNEAELLSEKLETLTDFLKNYHLDELSQKHKQYLLIEQRIIEMLLLIAELIDSKVYGVRKKDKEENKEDRRYNKNHYYISEEKWQTLIKTPQYIARKYLTNTSKQIYNILLIAMNHNTDVSSIALRYSGFLSRQVVYHKREAGSLLKAAIQNSIHLKDIDPHCEQVVQWVGMLEMIRETEGNLELQILYLEIISHACLGACKTGDPGHQNKVLQEFFSPNSNFLKVLIAFLKKNGKIYISFALDGNTTKDQFLTMNPSLSFANGITREEQNLKSYFSIYDLSRVKSQNVELIVDYLANVLWLFYCLCKNRNKDGINHIKGIGLHADVLISCMQDELVHVKLRRAFIILYDVLFIDVHPYKSIKDCTNHCYIWEEISKKKLSDFTYLWHNLSNEDRMERIRDYDREKVRAINDFILDFWVRGRNMDRGEESNASISDREYIQKAGLIYAALGFTKNAINLGFTNSEVNSHVLTSIICLFAAYCKDSKYQNPLENQSESWIFKFIRSRSLSTKHEIFNQIYCETLEILRILADLRLSLQVVGFLKVFKLCFDNGLSLDRTSFNQVFSFFFKKYSLNIPVTGTEVFDIESDYSQVLAGHLKGALPNESAYTQLKEIILETKSAHAKDTVRGGLVLLNTLFETTHKNKHIDKLVRKVLRDYFLQRQTLLENLKRIEIISGKKEIEIYYEFDSPERLEIQINKVLQDDENLRQNYKIDLSSYKTRIIDINNSLNRIITRFRERKIDTMLTLKMQNVMRNVKIHLSILKIFKLWYREPEYRDVFKSTILVLYYFCKYNAENQKELYPHISEFLSLIDKGLQPSKLISQILTYRKHDDECYHFIEMIFDLLRESENKISPSLPEYLAYFKTLNVRTWELNISQTLTEYLRILRNLTFDERMNPINRNQRLIMSRLMKSQKFFYVMEIRIPEKMKWSEIQEGDVMAIKYQVENILLLANLTMETKVGIVQARKIVTYDYLKSVLFSQSAPYIQKKAFLKCLYQIYMISFENFNEDFTKKKMADIFRHVVIPDLRGYERYIEGVIQNAYDNTKKRKHAQILRDQIKKSHPKLSHRDEKEEKLHPAFSHTNKNLHAAISQDDIKKVLRDSSEYWNYLTSGKPYDVRQYGLLYFIVDCCSEIEARGWVIDGLLKEHLATTKAILNKMNDVLLKMEEELNKTEPNLRLSKYTVIINECIDKIPGKKAIRIGKSVLSPGDRRASNMFHDMSKMETLIVKPLETAKSRNTEVPSDSIDVILNILKEYITVKKMAIEDFIAMFRASEDKISLEDFRNKLKTLLGTEIKLSDIENFVAGVQRSKKEGGDGDNTLSLIRLYRRLQKSFEKDRALHFKEMLKEEHGTLLEDLNSPDSSNISRSMKNFIDLYNHFGLSNGQLDNELREVVTDLFIQVKVQRDQDNIEGYRRSLDMLIKAFRKKHYNLYLFKMLKYLLKHFEEASIQQNNDAQANTSFLRKPVISPQNASINQFKRLQLIFVQSECLTFCLENIREGAPKKLVFEAISVMKLMLKNGHRQVQNYVLERIKSGNFSTSFLTFIKLQLWHTIELFNKIKETEENKPLDIDHFSKMEEDQMNFQSEILLDIQLTEEVVNLMQLCCENCCEGFQNFFNGSNTDSNTDGVLFNLVGETSNFLIDLHLTNSNIFKNSRLLPLVFASLQCLVGFCMGPCQANQKLLGSQSHLISFINAFLEQEIEFSSSNHNDLEMIDLLSLIIKFLLALINGNKDYTLKERLLDELSTDSLIRKLVIIYSTKIINRDTVIFRQEKRCPQGSNSQHKNGCGENYCVENYLSPKDLLLVETAFDIYILFTIFVEEFPSNPKLERFKYDKITAEEKSRLTSMEAQYHHHLNNKDKNNALKIQQNVLMQVSQIQLRRNRIAPMNSPSSPMFFKFPPSQRANLLLDLENPVSSPMNTSVDPLLQSHDISNRLSITQVFSPKQLSPSGLSPIKSIIDSVADKRPSFIDADLRRRQEDETFKEYFSLHERSTLYKARKFFKKYINSVEISRNGQVSKNYFQVPFECDYITKNIRDDLFFEVHRNSHTERLEHLFHNIPLYHVELKHRQGMSRVLLIEWSIGRWRLFKDIAYIFVIANNIDMVALLEDDKGEIVMKGSTTTFERKINLIFSVVQIVLSIIVLLFGIYERLPISLYRKPRHLYENRPQKENRPGTIVSKRHLLPMVQSGLDFIKGKIADAYHNVNSHTKFITDFLLIIADRQNLYNISYLSVSIIAFATHPLVYSILLLDIVKRSEDLQNIIRSISNNMQRLLKTIYFGLIIMFLYAIIIFVFFQDPSNKRLYCDTLVNCWTSVVTYGVRTTGGVGSVMQQLKLSDHYFWSRWIFDISFFFFVRIIILKIIFGIIIDTFRVLRDRRKVLKLKTEETCFICGLSKHDFERRGNGWYEHIYKEHNIYAYLNFCIYINKKEVTECNGVEKYVKGMIARKDIGFIPQKLALAFQE